MTNYDLLERFRMEMVKEMTAACDRVIARLLAEHHTSPAKADGPVVCPECSGDGLVECSDAPGGLGFETCPRCTGEPFPLPT